MSDWSTGNDVRGLLGKGCSDEEREESPQKLMAGILLLIYLTVNLFTLIAITMGTEVEYMAFWHYPLKLLAGLW